MNGDESINVCQLNRDQKSNSDRFLLFLLLLGVYFTGLRTAIFLKFISFLETARMIFSTKTALFLGVTCVSAIAAVGSVFELSSGEPQLGSPLTTVILALSIPLTVVCFYVAVRDARANNQ